MIPSCGLRVFLRLFFLCLATQWTHTLTAQNCTPIFHKTYNGSGSDEAMDVMVTSDGGSIVAGRTTTNSPASDGFLLRLDAQGNIVWAKSYGGAGYDDLLKVRQTMDGGFVAVGMTKSFGLAVGETWIIKTDAGGNVSWSQHISSGRQQTKPKRIIELSGGGYVLAMNANDSTVQGNAHIIRTDRLGNVIWSKLFDNGKDDGVNNLYGDGITLLVAGYATVQDREGILMRLDLSDGSVIRARSFARRAGTGDEIVEVEAIPGGLAFGASSTEVTSSFGSTSYDLTVFKTRGEDSIFFQRKISVLSASPTIVENLEMRSTADSGFLYAFNDVTQNGWGSYRKMSPGGQVEWGRQLTNSFGNRRVKGFDLYGQTGYLLAGFYSDFSTGNRSRIQVLKTDVLGSTGSCSGTIGSTYSDTTFYRINPFTWSSITSGQVYWDYANPVVSPLNLNVNTVCSDTYCDAPDVSTDSSCFATFLTHLKGRTSFVPFDVIKTPGAYYVTGYNRNFINSEPMLIKVGLNGTVQWSKTLINYIHDQNFDQVLLTPEGNLLITGRDDYTIYHGGNIGSDLVLVSPGGTVLWSKYLNGEVYDLKPRGNGQYTGCLIANYGFPPIYVTLFRMDGNGNIVFQRQLNQAIDNHPVFRRIAVEGPYTYAAGEYYNQTPANIEVAKLDSAGNSLWRKTFSVNGFSTSVEDVEIIGDSVYVFANFYDNSANPFFAKKKLAVVKLSKDGQGMNAFSLTNIDLVGDPKTYSFHTSRFHTVCKTYDNQFLLADRAGAGRDSSLVLTKFTPAGQVTWSRRYDNLNSHYISNIRDDNGSLLLVGRKFTGTVDQTYMFETLLMRTDNNGVVTLNGTGNCQSTLINVQSAPVALVTASAAGSQGSAGMIITTPYVPFHRPYTINSNFGCGINSTCSSLRVSGPKAVCTGDTITYTATRNPGCVVPMLWRFDTTNVQIIGMTDSSLAVHFIREGATLLTASLLSACGEIRDTLPVMIHRSANTLSLGADTTLCVGNTVVLNAHRGFLSYRWQDGSTDSTFAVRQPGIYYVTVGDACGKTFTDTVNVLPHPPVPFEVSPDRSKCNGDTIRFAAPAGFLNYTWTPAYNISSLTQPNVTVNPQVDTSYVVKAEKEPGCFAYDTIRVRVNHSPPINLGSDVSFCSGDSVTLDAGSGFSSYVWNGASGGQTKTVRTAGAYSVEGKTSEGCRSYDTLRVLNVWSLPKPNLDKSGELCFGATRLLDAGVFSSYLWQDGSTTATYTVSDLGRYWVQVTDNHSCVGGDTADVTTILPLPGGFLPGDTAICSYGTLVLKPLQGFVSYAWNTGSTQSTITINKAGEYWLKATDQKGCAGRDTVTVNLRQCTTGVYIPTAFTPNRDGRNDEFKAMVFGKATTFALTVFNRWGQVIFYTADPARGWDGKVGGTPQVTGVFVWTCRYQLEGGMESYGKGTVTLIR